MSQYTRSMGKGQVDARRPHLLCTLMFVMHTVLSTAADDTGRGELDELLESGKSDSLPDPTGELYLAVNNTEQRLYDHLYRYEHTKHIRPIVRSASEPVEVALGISLYKVLSLNLAEGRLTAVVWLRASWYDPRLDWEAADFGGITSLSVDKDRIWLPDYIVFNHVERWDKDIYQDTSVRVFSDGGGCYWARPGVIRTTCDIDVGEWPFDTQNCEYYLASWTADSRTQVLATQNYTVRDIHGESSLVTNGAIDLSNYQRISEYTVTTSAATVGSETFPCCPDEPWPFVKFHMALNRRSMYYLRNMILPITATTYSSFLTFVLPVGSGERVGLGMTCMLVIASIMYISSDIVPVTEESTIFGTLQIGEFMFAVWSLGTTVCVLALHNHYRRERHRGGEDKLGNNIMTDYFGLTPSKALKLANEMDVISAIFVPAYHTVFVGVTMNPQLSRWPRIALGAGLFVAHLVAVSMLSFIVYVVRNFSSKSSEYAGAFFGPHKLFTQTFRQKAKKEIKKKARRLSGIQTAKPSDDDDDEEGGRSDKDTKRSGGGMATWSRPSRHWTRLSTLRKSRKFSDIDTGVPSPITKPIVPASNGEASAAQDQHVIASSPPKMQRVKSLRFEDDKIELEPSDQPASRKGSAESQEIRSSSERSVTIDIPPPPKFRLYPEQTQHTYRNEMYRNPKKVEVAMPTEPEVLQPDVLGPTQTREHCPPTAPNAHVAVIHSDGVSNQPNAHLSNPLADPQSKVQWSEPEALADPHPNVQRPPAIPFAASKPRVHWHPSNPLTDSHTNGLAEPSPPSPMLEIYLRDNEDLVDNDLNNSMAFLQERFGTATPYKKQ